MTSTHYSTVAIEGARFNNTETCHTFCGQELPVYQYSMDIKSVTCKDCANRYWAASEPTTKGTHPTTPPASPAGQPEDEAMRNQEKIKADVESDWSRPKDRDTIKRRHSKATDDTDCKEREVQLRIALSQLPSTFEKEPQQ